MNVIPDYRGHRIDVVAVPDGDHRFNAEVRIRQTLSDAKPHVETVTCLKVSAALAEQAGERWAKRHIDLLLTFALGLSPVKGSQPLPFDMEIRLFDNAGHQVARYVGGLPARMRLTGVWTPYVDPKHGDATQPDKR